MSRVGFIGLGNMGGPMAANLVRAGHDVRGYDLSEAARALAEGNGVRIADSASDACVGADVVITMLTRGEVVRDVLLTKDAVFDTLPAETLVIDASTIDVATTRELHEAAAERKLAYIDAPVSGGVGGATAGTLTFMVGGERDVFDRSQNVLSAMGKKIVHAGGAGSGQAVKVLNNTLFAVSLTAASEVFVLANALGLDIQTVHEIFSSSSADCWAIHNFCPWPGIVENSAADNDYAPRFSSRLMNKDLHLALAAAAGAGQELTLGTIVAAMFNELAAQDRDVDTSAIIQKVPGYVSSS